MTETRCVCEAAGCWCSRPQLPIPRRGKLLKPQYYSLFAGTRADVASCSPVTRRSMHGAEGGVVYGFDRWLLEPALKRNRARLAGPRVGAFWRLGDPAWISLPGPAWLGGTVNLPVVGRQNPAALKLRSGVKNARPKSRNRKLESISLQRRVSSPLDPPPAEAQSAM
jgi:hypothetical protein